MAVNNAAIKGSLVVLKIGNDDGPPETFTKLAGARGVVVAFNNTPIEATTADDIDADGVTWGSSIPGTVNYSVQVNGVMKTAAPLVALMEASAQGTTQNFQLDATGKFTITGPATVSNFEVTGDFGDIATYSCTVNANGIQTIAAAV